MADPITIATGSHIQFKHGLQSKLDEIRSAKSGTSGTFYLTNDTHRLYVGLSDNSVVPVNEGITTYANISALPAANAMNAGQFAYITADSILAVSNGTQWVQINANTDTQYTYSGLTETDTTSGKVTITTKLSDKANSTKFTQYAFSLVGADGVKIVETTEDGGITVYGSKLKHEVVAANNELKLKLVDKSGAVVPDSTVTVKGGTNVQIADQNGVVVLTATDTKLDGEATHGSALENGFQILAKDKSGATSGGKIDPIIKYGAGETKSTAHFNNGTATLNVYTKDEVDALKTQFDAMEYKGVTSGLPTATDIQNGWTYKANASFEIPAANSSTGAKVTVYPGDLVIAETAEGATTIKWGFVPSGNEDTTYKVELIEKGITIKEFPIGNSVGTAIGSIALKDGTNITVSPNSDASDKSMSLTINHNNVTRTDAVQNGAQIINQSAVAAHNMKHDTVTVIDASVGNHGIDTDAQGHITAVHTKTIDIYDTNARLADTGIAVSADTAKTTATVTLTPTLVTSKNETIKKAANFYVKSLNENLQITASGTTVQADFVWGTF